MRINHYNQDYDRIEFDDGHAYEIDMTEAGQLGKGASNTTVRKAYRIDPLTKTVDKKTLLAFKTCDEEEWKKHGDEASILPRVYETDPIHIVNKKVYIFTKHLPGKELLKSRKLATLDFSECVKLISWLLSQYNTFHHNKLFDPAFVHADVKSENLLLQTNLDEIDEDEIDEEITAIHAIDFGLSENLKDRDDVFVGKFVSGTPGYRAPETLFRGEYSTKSDIYSLTAVLLIILRGGAKDIFVDRDRACVRFNRAERRFTAPFNTFNLYKIYKIYTARKAYLDRTKVALAEATYRIRELKRRPQENNLPFNINNLLKVALHKMQSFNPKDRFNIDDLLKFFTTLNNLCLLLDDGVDQDNEHLIYVYGAKLILLLSGRWDTKIGEREIAHLDPDC